MADEITGTRLTVDPAPPAFHFTETPIKLIYYECMNPKCGAKDQQKLFVKEATPVRGIPGYVINCWKCGAGRAVGGHAVSPDEMLAKRLGMVMTGSSEAADEAAHGQKVTDIRPDGAKK